ncbi:hypothetical protein AA101099_1465 [Neoasaia chiangmaiensis NBRC 101099]|nr:hypothetical protein AA101099_1465 [Neoasaia chiangmaiensis NBRC 101099]
MEAPRNHLSIALPEGWRDESTILIKAPVIDMRMPFAPIFGTQREPLPEDFVGMGYEGLELYAQHHLRYLKREYENVVVEADPANSLDRSMREMIVRCDLEEMTVTQWITLSYWNEATVLITTAAAGYLDFPSLEQTFRRLRETLRIS